MKTRRIALLVIAASLLLAGCATTDTELTQKEKDKLARDQARAEQKQAQDQAKMMRDATQGASKKGIR